MNRNLKARNTFLSDTAFIKFMIDSNIISYYYFSRFAMLIHIFENQYEIFFSHFAFLPQAQNLLPEKSTWIFIEINNNFSVHFNDFLQ